MLGSAPAVLRPAAELPARRPGFRKLSGFMQSSRRSARRPEAGIKARTQSHALAHATFAVRSRRPQKRDIAAKRPVAALQEASLVARALESRLLPKIDPNGSAAPYKHAEKRSWPCCAALAADVRFKTACDDCEHSCKMIDRGSRGMLSGGSRPSRATAPLVVSSELRRPIFGEHRSSVTRPSWEVTRAK